MENMEKWHGKSEIIPCKSKEKGILVILAAVYSRSYYTLRPGEHKGFAESALISHKQGEKLIFKKSFQNLEEAKKYATNTLKNLENLKREGEPIIIAGPEFYITFENGTAMPFGHQN